MTSGTKKGMRDAVCILDPLNLSLAPSLDTIGVLVSQPTPTFRYRLVYFQIRRLLSKQEGVGRGAWIKVFLNSTQPGFCVVRTVHWS